MTPELLKFTINLPNFPAKLLMMTICPEHLSSIYGKTFLVMEIGASAFNSSISRSTSIEVSAMDALCDLPALFIRISI